MTPRTAESDAKQEPHRCCRHRLGGDRSDDELLIAMKDAKKFCAVYEPEEADVTVFETGDFWSNTIRIRPLDSEGRAADDLVQRQVPGRGELPADRMYFRTNDDAPNWKVMAATLRQAGVRATG